jgi:hypothetical protein
MRKFFLMMVGFCISMTFIGELQAQASNVYYHVGMNKAPEGIIPGVNVFSPLGGVVSFRFVDYMGAEYLAEVDCSSIASQAFTLSDLVPTLPESVYFVEISGTRKFGMTITDECDGIITPHVNLCRMQGTPQEISGTFDDYFRLYSESDATINVFDENLDSVGQYSLTGGVPQVVAVPQGPNTSYVLSSATPFAASIHDLPNSTGLFQCVKPNDF